MIQTLYEEARPNTVVPKKRCFMLYQFSKQIGELRGEVAEIGVYKGGTAKLLASICAQSGKPLHLFDTFEGMPQTDSHKDTHMKGDFGLVTRLCTVFKLS